MHLLRSSFTDAFLDLASAFDVVVHEAFEQSADCTFDVDTLAGRQLTLPHWAGGCGYTSMRRIAPAAYLGSWMACLGHVEAAVGGALLRDGCSHSPTKVAVAQAEACMQESLADYRLLDWRNVAQILACQGTEAFDTSSPFAGSPSMEGHSPCTGPSSFECLVGLGCFSITPDCTF